MFRQELDSHESNFILRIIFSKLFYSSIQVISFAFHKVVINIIYMIIIYDFVYEIIDIQLGSAIDYGFYLVKKFLELQTFCLCQIIQINLAIDALNDRHFQHRLLGNCTYTEFFRTFYLIIRTIFFDQLAEFLTKAFCLTSTDTLDILKFLHIDRIHSSHLFQ